MFSDILYKISFFKYQKKALLSQERLSLSVNSGIDVPAVTE